MKPKETNKILALSELQAKKNCKWCGGRGTLTMIPSPVGHQKHTPQLVANKYRLVVPCGCVHTTIEWNE